MRVRSRLQDERRAAGARRHVGHAPELRREQRAGGLLEASHSSLTTASAADLWRSTATRAADFPTRLEVPDQTTTPKRSLPNLFQLNAGTPQVRNRGAK